MGGGGDKASLVTTDTQETCTSLSKTLPVALPRLERVLDLSMMALLLGLFSTDLLANDMSAVTLVMDILKTNRRKTFNRVLPGQTRRPFTAQADASGAHLPSNLCFRKSNSAFCIMSVTWKDESDGTVGKTSQGSRGFHITHELGVDLAVINGRNGENLTQTACSFRRRKV